MYLKEKIKELNELKIKLNLLKKYVNNKNNLESDYNNKVITKLFNTLENIQNAKLVIRKINSQTNISIGNSSVDLNTAVIIRDTLKEKINTITELIDNNTDLDIISLIEQRDAFIEELDSIGVLISITDWSVKID